MSLIKWFSLAMSAVFLMSGCASSKMKERKETREKVSQSSRLYCEFINGEIYPDVDVALNIEMAKHCDADRPFTISQYRTPSENQGVLYCCSIVGAKSAPANWERPIKKESKIKDAINKDTAKEPTKDSAKDSKDEIE